MKPINVEKLQRLLIRKWRKTYNKRVQDMRATDPAPAVCEWTEDVWTPDVKWYRRRCDGKTYERDYRHLACPSCGLPIKFTEAK